MHGRTQVPAQVLSDPSPQLPPLSHVSTLCVMTVMRLTNLVCQVIGMVDGTR